MNTNKTGVLRRIRWIFPALAVNSLLVLLGINLVQAVIYWSEVVESSAVFGGELIQRFLFMGAFAGYLLIFLCVLGPLYILYRIWYDFKGKDLLQPA